MADIPTNTGDAKAPLAGHRDLAVWAKLLDEANAKPKPEPAFDNSKIRLYTNPGVCASCHPQKEKNDFKLDLKSFDFKPVDYGSFAKPNENRLQVVADTPESRNAREIEKFQKEDPLAKTSNSCL
jgi:hypothetical protein